MTGVFEPFPKSLDNVAKTRKLSYNGPELWSWASSSASTCLWCLSLHILARWQHLWRGKHSASSISSGKTTDVIPEPASVTTARTSNRSCISPAASHCSSAELILHLGPRRPELVCKSLRRNKSCFYRGIPCWTRFLKVFLCFVTQTPTQHMFAVGRHAIQTILTAKPPTLDWVFHSLHVNSFF